MAFGLESLIISIIKVLDLRFVASVLLFIYSALWIMKKYNNYKVLREVYGYPMPKLSNPIFGHMNEFSNRINEFRWHKELGKLFGFYYGDSPMLKVSDPSLVNEIFLKQNKLFEARILSDYRVKILERSILFNTGQRWKRSRKLIQPALAQYKSKEGNTTTINDIQCGIDKLIDHFKKITRYTGEPDVQYKDDKASQYATKGYVSVENSSSPTGWAIDFSAYDLMQAVTMDVIFRIAFNMDTIDVLKGSSEPSLKIVSAILHAADSTLYKLASTVPVTRIFFMPWMLLFDNTFKSYRAFQKHITEHNLKPVSQEKKEQPDQPRRIYNILRADYKAGNITRREFRSNLLATCVAGFETTAATSSYILWCIAKHTHCKQRLRSEIMCYGIESEYLDMFIKEVMRMYPALPNFVIRTPHEDTTLNGYKIKRGMSVYLSINSIHYDESIWLQPYKFDPERFAKGKTYPPGAYAPFGLGHRMCAGYQLALREMKTIVCEIMTNFDVQLIAPYEMTLESSTIFLSQPTNEIRLRLVPLAARPGAEAPADLLQRIHPRLVDIGRTQSAGC